MAAVDSRNQSLIFIEIEFAAEQEEFKLVSDLAQVFCDGDGTLVHGAFYQSMGLGVKRTSTSMAFVVLVTMHEPAR